MKFDLTINTQNILSEIVTEDNSASFEVAIGNLLKGQGYTEKGEWDELTHYMPYDVVHYLNSVYVCLVENEGSLPTNENTDWEMWLDTTEFLNKTAIKQDLGDSETDVMSQKAVTDELDTKANHGYESNPKTLKEVEDDLVGDLFHIKGKYITANYGKEGNSELINRTNYIPFKRDSGITVKGRGNPNVALIAFYDVNRVFISSISGSEYNNILTTFEPSDIPEDAKYIIASCNADVGGVLDVVTFKNILDLIVETNDAILEENEKAKLHTDKTIGEIFSLPKTYINRDGVLRETLDAISTDFIPFDKKSPIKVKGRNNSSVNLLSFYDINGKYISGYGGDVSLTTITVEPADFPIDAVTIRATGTMGTENILECGIVLGNSAQISRLDDRIHNIYGNPFAENNSFVKNDGTITSPFENASITELIRFDPSVAIKVKGRSNYLIALIAFYDIDNKFISSLYGDEYDDKIITILPSEIPTNAFSLRATCWTDKGGILEYGVVVGINRQINKVNSDLNNKIDTLKGDYFSIKGSYIRQQTGVQKEFEGIRCTPFIRINPDAVIKVKGRSNNATALIAFYDNDKKHISSIFGVDNNDVLKTINPVDIPTGTSYIRCSVTEGYEGLLETEIISGILEELQIRQSTEEPTEPIVVSSGSYVNVTELHPIVGYHTKSSARSAIPLAERHSGIVLSYAISENNWIRETFISKDLSQWVRDSLWERLDNDDVTDFIETVDGNEMIYTGDEFGNKKLVSIKDLQKYFIDSQSGFPKPEDTLFYPSHIDLIDNKWVDKSGNENDASLVQSYCGNAKVGNIMKFANSLQGSISDWTMTSDGTAVATLAIDGIRFTQEGTIYNIRITNNVLDKEHFYPVSEGTMAVYDCSGNSNHITLIDTLFLEWISSKQDEFHYNLKKGGSLTHDQKMLSNPTLTGDYVDGLVSGWSKYNVDTVSEETSITINGKAQRVVASGIGSVSSRMDNRKYRRGDLIKVTAKVYTISGSSNILILDTDGAVEISRGLVNKVGEWQTVTAYASVISDGTRGLSIMSRTLTNNSEWILGDVKTEVISTKVCVPALENGMYDALGRVIEVSPKSIFKVETGVKFTPNNQLIEADVDNLLFDNLGSPNTVVVSDVDFAVENMLYENRIFANCGTNEFLIFSNNLDKNKLKSLLDKWGKSPIHIYRNSLEYLPIDKNYPIDVVDINKNYRVGVNYKREMFVSNDYGKTWSTPIVYPDTYQIHHIFITSKGSVLIFYFKSIIRRMAWGETTFTRVYPIDENGVPIVMHTPINPECPGEYYKPYHKLLDIYDASDNSSLIAWGTWNNNAGSNGAAPQALFYSTDDCATIKRFYYFGQNPGYSDKGTSDAMGGDGTLLGDPDNPMYCRHIHELSLNKYTGKIYASCGDAHTRPEMHFLELEYNKETDTWSEPIDLIADATRNQIHRFIGVGFDKDGYMYFGSDADFIPYTENGVTYDTQGVFKVHIDNINDITKYELIHEARDIVVNSFMYDDIFIYSLQGHEHIVFVSRDKGTTWNRIDTSEYFTDDYPHNLTMIDGRKRIASYIIDDRGNVLAKGGKGIYMNILGK